MEVAEFFQTVKTPATILHVVSVVFGMGGALVSDLLFSFFSKDKNLNKTELATLSLLAKMVFWSLWLIVLSGLMIFLSDTDYYLNSHKFLAKMTILLILILNGYVLNTYVWPHLLKKKFFTAKGERGIRKVAFVCGAISVISWLSVLALGILDSLLMSYLSIIYIYLMIVIVGGFVAIIVERKELN